MRQTGLNVKHVDDTEHILVELSVIIQCIMKLFMALKPFHIFQATITAFIVSYLDFEWFKDNVLHSEKVKGTFYFSQIKILNVWSAFIHPPSFDTSK